jgi:hypothetical protein
MGPGQNEGMKRTLLFVLALIAAAPVDGVAQTVEEYRDKVLLEALAFKPEGEGLALLGCPCLEGRVRNTGDRTVQRVKLVVYFLDDEGIAIGEESRGIVTYFPKGSVMSGLGDESPLRPNYVKDFRITLDGPSVWGGVRHRVELGEIEFLEEASN